MHAIFGPAAQASVRPRSPLPGAPASSVPVARTSSLRRIGMPLAVLTCVAGAAAGLVVVAPLRQIAPPAARAPTHVAPHDVPTAMAVTAPVAPAPAPVEAPPARIADAAPALRIDDAPRAAPAPAWHAARGDEARGDGCLDADDDDYGACSRAEVLAADRDLRQAYLRAIDAGVDRDRLVSIRDRWARLRATRADRPEALLAGYAALAERLERAAQDAGDDLR